MKFLHPFWLWCVLVLPFYYAFILFYEKRRQSRFENFINKKLWSQIVPEYVLSYRPRKARVFLLSLVFLFLALARPQLGSHEETVQASGLDVMLVLDVSNSMESEDVIPSRLKKAKHLIHALVNQMDGDRVGVVAFAGGAYVASPLTTDLSYLWETVQILGPKTISSQGTDISVGLEAAFKSLDRGAEESGASRPGAAPSRAIILISDGEDHEKGALQIASKIKENATKLYVLGVGTTAGGAIPIHDENGNTVGFKRDHSGQAILSHFNPTDLKKIAETGNGRYWDISSSEAEVGELLKDLGSLSQTDYAERRFLVYEDRFQIPLAIAVFLFFLEISMPVRKILVITLLLMFPGLARADELLKKPAPLDTYLENQKGVQAYQEGKLEEAQKSFGAAQARDPNLPELEYNQGLVQLQRGEADSAIEAFQSSAQSALQQKNKSLFGKSLYNLGASYAKKGDIRNAIRAYSGAIHSAIEQKDQKLEDDARKNLQLLVNEDKQKKQKQKQDQDKKDNKQDQDQKNQKDQNKQEEDKKDQQKNQQPKKEDSSKDNSSQSDEDKKKENKKDQESQADKDNKDNNKDSNKDNKDKQYQEPKKENQKKQQFKSEKMSPEDADRVMAELKNKERELLEKFNKQNGKMQSQTKDW